MFKCVLHFAPESHRIRLRWGFLLGVILLTVSQLKAQKYVCTIKVSHKGQVAKKNASALNILVEKYYDDKLMGFLGKYDVRLPQKTNLPISFVGNVGWTIRIKLTGSLLKSPELQQVFEIRQKDQFQQNQEIPLKDKTTLVIKFMQQLIDEEEGSVKQKPRLSTRSELTKIQGITGVLVTATYRLPPGISKGTGYLKAIVGTLKGGKPIWVYQLDKNKKLVNNLLVQLKDTTKFQLFVPVHERPYWVSKLDFQLIHAFEGRLLEHFRTEAYSQKDNQKDVTTTLFLQPTSSEYVQPQGVFVGAKVKIPPFYVQDLRRNQITVRISGDVNPGNANVWHYQVYLIEELAKAGNRLIVQESFIPYAWLAKFADTTSFQLKTKMFLMGHRGTQFYNGYPRQQSHLVSQAKEKLRLILPDLHQLKIRPVLFKNKKNRAANRKKLNKESREVKVFVRVGKYELYHSKSYTSKRTIRFNKVNREVLHLAKNDNITIEVKDNSYPSRILFSTELACTAEILKQKFWKLRDKKGNYLKIAVQKVTTEKDKLLHSNDKKQTKMLGGSR